jgi:alkylation response protein AidB-like acyl-CoA dehydrogenase
MLSQVKAIDPDASLFRVNGEVSSELTTGLVVEDPEANWREFAQLCHRGVAHQLVTLAEDILADARAYSLDRYQFGRAIGSFQAIKHLLAEVAVAIAGARSVLDKAWDESGDPLATLTARSLATQGFNLAVANCKQVFGAMGFTWEHKLHRRLRRGILMAELLGGRGAIPGAVGQLLVDQGTLARVSGLASL